MRWTLTDWQSKNKTSWWKKAGASDAERLDTGLTNEEDDDKKKGKEVPKKKMNGRELHTHVRALFKEMMAENRDEFLKGAEEAGFWKGELSRRQYLLISMFTL
jgi:hypothetical protein